MWLFQISKHGLLNVLQKIDRGSKEDGYGVHIPVIHNDGTYGPNIVSFMKERGISWSACCVDAEWDFTPNEQGAFFKDVMLRIRDGKVPLGK